MSVTPENGAGAAEYRAFRERGGVVDLASRVKLLFTGGDRIRYINGQVTANIAGAKCPSVIPACVTTAKGRLCADVFVSIGPSGVLVDADPAVAEVLPGRLERYIIADDVTMEDVRESIAIVHFAGMKPDAVPEEIRAGLVPSNRFGVAGFDFFPPFRKDLPPVWEKITANLPVLSEALLELIRIEHGVPRWGFELDESTLPAGGGARPHAHRFSQGLLHRPGGHLAAEERRPREPRTARVRLDGWRAARGGRAHFLRGGAVARSRTAHECRVQFRARPPYRARLPAQGCRGRGIPRRRAGSA